MSILRRYKWLFLSVLLFFSALLLLKKEEEEGLSFSYGTSELPYTTATIQGQKVSVLIDTGMSSEMSIPKAISMHLKKQPKDAMIVYSIKEEGQVRPRYQIDKVEFNRYILKNILVAEFEEKLDTRILYDKTEALQPQKEITGSIGQALLERFNVLFDFQRQKLFLIEDKKKPKGARYHLDTFTKISLQKMPEGRYIFIAHTDRGDKRMMIDTGCTRSLMREEFFPEVKEDPQPGIPYFHTEHFKIGDKDYGPHEFYLFKLGMGLENIDAILGMDFLKDRIIYIDYHRRILFLKDVEVIE